MIKTFLLLVFLSAVRTSPLPAKPSSSENRVLYDQRQEGEWNVHANLENFVILIIPTQTSTSTPAPGPSLLDFLVKTVPKRAHLKRIQHHLKKNQAAGVPGEETMHFIESKTAPYHVDISRSRNHLAKLHPETNIPVVNAEEIVIAKSPTIALVKDENNHTRTARAFVLTVPHEDDKKKKDGKKKKEAPKSILKLLGAENEQCGPGLERDLEGICRLVKN